MSINIINYYKIFLMNNENTCWCSSTGYGFSTGTGTCCGTFTICGTRIATGCFTGTGNGMWWGTWKPEKIITDQSYLHITMFEKLKIVFIYVDIKITSIIILFLSLFYYIIYIIYMNNFTILNNIKINIFWKKIVYYILFHLLFSFFFRI